MSAAVVELILKQITVVRMHEDRIKSVRRIAVFVYITPYQCELRLLSRPQKISLLRISSMLLHEILTFGQEAKPGNPVTYCNAAGMKTSSGGTCILP